MLAENLSLYLLSLQYKKINKNDIKPQRNEKTLLSQKKLQILNILSLIKGVRQILFRKYIEIMIKEPDFKNSMLYNYKRAHRASFLE